MAAGGVRGVRGVRGAELRRGMAPKARALGLALVAALALTGCSLGSIAGGDGSDGVGLSALPWCAQPQLSFVDSSSSSQQTLTNWDQVKGRLGFTPYLPPTLPKGACLDLVGATIHDPIFGGRLSVTWILPSGDPISFSEAPRRGNTGGSPQCAQSAKGTDATIVCIGAVGDTSVTIASHLTQSQITDYFKQLQPASDWEPAPAR
jgi:hypothetical protein